MESFVSEWRFCKSISEDIMECSPNMVARIIARVSTRNVKRNKYIFFCYRKISKYSSKHRWNFYPAVGNTRVVSVRYILPLFCFGQFVFNVMSSNTVPAFASHCYRAASPVVTEM